jgi:ubiquinone/menaquinone biosynthesis C-methylase UbiE
MDPNLLKQVNRLWRKIYPYLASQIRERYQRDSGAVLELGPFSGGISVEMARRHPGLDIIITDESSQVLEGLKEEINTEGFSDVIDIRKSVFNPLVFENSEFDLVISRGVFFFLDEEGDLLREIFRMLKEGGMAFIGGGYGKDTPPSLINEIADESRELNDRLGRTRVRVEALEKIITRSGLDDHCKIVEEGGLWVVIDEKNY